MPTFREICQHFTFVFSTEATINIWPWCSWKTIENTTWLNDVRLGAHAGPSWIQSLIKKCKIHALVVFCIYVICFMLRHVQKVTKIIWPSRLPPPWLTGTLYGDLSGLSCFWPNTFCNFDKCILLCLQIHFPILTNAFCYVYKNIFQFWQMHFAMFTNTFSNFDKCILQCLQIHFAILTNAFWNVYKYIL